MLTLLTDKWPKTSANKHLYDVFQDLYHFSPGDFMSAPRKLRDTINCEVTIRTLNTVNSGLDRPILERQTALEHIETIRNKYPKLTGDNFDDDSDVKRRLLVVQEFTRKIVQ